MRKSLPHERSLHNLSGPPAGVRSVIRIQNNERDARSVPYSNDSNKKPQAVASCSAEESSKSFRISEPIYRPEDVVLNHDTRSQLETLITIIRKHDFIYTEWGLGCVDPRGCVISVNFYGPPGTGKTMCAMALAHAFNKRIVDVDYAELESKYVGDTGKNIEAAFRFAREHDAVLFFDEADSILGKRMSRVTQATDHAVNTARAVMLKQLEHHEGIVVFATNLAENFDKAFTRRILSHIEVGLPDEESRRALWQRFMMPTVPGCEDIDLEEPIKASAGMSGGDIKNAFVKACALACLESEPRLCAEHLLTAIAQVRKIGRDAGCCGGITRDQLLSPEEIEIALNS